MVPRLRPGRCCRPPTAITSVLRGESLQFSFVSTPTGLNPYAGARHGPARVPGTRPGPAVTGTTKMSTRFGFARSATRCGTRQIARCVRTGKARDEMKRPFRLMNRSFSLMNRSFLQTDGSFRLTDGSFREMERSLRLMNGPIRLMNRSSCQMDGSFRQLSRPFRQLSRPFRQMNRSYRDLDRPVGPSMRGASGVRRQGTGTPWKKGRCLCSGPWTMSLWCWLHLDRMQLTSPCHLGS